MGNGELEMGQIRHVTYYTSCEGCSSSFQEHKRMCWPLRGRKTRPERYPEGEKEDSRAPGRFVDVVIENEGLLSEAFCFLNDIGLEYSVQTASRNGVGGETDSEIQRMNTLREIYTEMSGHF